MKNKFSIYMRIAAAEISAILIFDTLLGVGGATIAGSQARVVFGPQFVIWFSVVLSATLLFVSQIIPKIVGEDLSSIEEHSIG